MLIYKVYILCIPFITFSSSYTFADWLSRLVDFDTVVLVAGFLGLLTVDRLRFVWTIIIAVIIAAALIAVRYYNVGNVEFNFVNHIDLIVDVAVLVVGGIAIVFKPASRLFIVVILAIAEITLPYILFLFLYSACPTSTRGLYSFPIGSL
jgi:hypothetical protein